MAAGFFRGRPAFATVQTECSKISKAGANIIFIEKRRFSSASLEDAFASSVASFPPPAKNLSHMFEIFENYGIIMQVICVGYSGT